MDGWGRWFFWGQVGNGILSFSSWRQSILKWTLKMIQKPSNQWVLAKSLLNSGICQRRFWVLYHETELCETTRFSYQCHLSGFFSEVIEWSKLGAPRKPFHKNGATALQMTTPTKIGGKARNPRNLYPEAVFFFFCGKTTLQANPVVGCGKESLQKWDETSRNDSTYRIHWINLPSKQWVKYGEFMEIWIIPRNSLANKPVFFSKLKTDT